MDETSSEQRLGCSPESEPDIRVRRQAAAGRITLNRLSAYNALSGAMVITMRTALEEFAASPSISLVIIDSASPRFFCVGGDLDPVRQLVRQGDTSAALAHCKREYELDLAIANYPKPVIALIDGLVMGGGIGISCHASHPAISERTRLALPETSIGWVPDSGINSILAKAPGQTGKYLALTGMKISAGDMLHMGFGKHLVRSSCIPGLIDALAVSGTPNVLAEFIAPHPKSELATIQPEINEVFAGADLETIISRLQNHTTGSWQANALRKIDRNSKSTCKLALEILNTIEPETPLTAAMDLEFRVVKKLISHPDFALQQFTNAWQRSRYGNC